MGGGPSVSAPPVDPQQQALEAAQASLLQQQTGILQQQASDQKIIAPFLYQSMGLTPTYDDKGNLTGLTQNPDVAANQKLQTQVTGQLLTQEQQAISGTLPVNPLVKQTLDQQQRAFENTMNANLGPGWQSSTPGIQATNSFNQSKAGIIQGANTGQMTLDQQLASAGQANSASIQGQTMGGVGGVNNLGFNTASAFGAAAQGYGAAMQPYEFQSGQNLQAQLANAQMYGQGMAGLGQLAGTAAMAAAIYGKSERWMKQDIRKIGIHPVLSIPVYSFRYKPEWQDEYGSVTHIGLMADDVEPILPNAIEYDDDGSRLINYSLINVIAAIGNNLSIH